MRSFAAIAAIAGLASAHASSGWDKPVYKTEVVTAYTTYCPSATKITHGASTYTVTEATTLTISNCPCTITRPVETSVYSTSICVKPTGAPVPPAPSASSYVVPAPKPSSATTSAPVATYTGAASKAQVAGGLLAAMGLVAAAL